MRLFNDVRDDTPTKIGNIIGGAYVSSATVPVSRFAAAEAGGERRKSGRREWSGHSRRTDSTSAIRQAELTARAARLRVRQ